MIAAMEKNEIASKIMGKEAFKGTEFSKIFI
jgi:hypothetical protein